MRIERVLLRRSRPRRVRGSSSNATVGSDSKRSNAAMRAWHAASVDVVDTRVRQPVEQLPEPRVRVRAEAEDAIQRGRTRGLFAEPGHRHSCARRLGQRREHLDELGALVVVENGEVAAEHAVGARLGQSPAIVQRLGVGVRLRPPEHAEHRRGPDHDRLDRREPDGQHRGTVQRAPQLAQRVEPVQRERLDVVGFVERTPAREHRRARDRRRVHHSPEQCGDGLPVDLVGQVRRRPRVRDRGPLARGLLTRHDRRGALPRRVHAARREEHERGDHHIGGTSPSAPPRPAM